MKDFNLKVTVRNARLLHRVREKYGTAAECARQAGVNKSGLAALMTMKAKPFRKDGDLTECASKICSALGCYPEDLWPEHIADIQTRRATTEMEFSRAEVMQITGAEDGFVRRELLEKWADQLRPREHIAIQAAREGWTFEELGEELGGVSRERARQIQIKALRKMRQAAGRDGITCISEASA